MYPKVKVLLSYYNGDNYIKEQIDSILKQEDVDVSLVIRNDGSSRNIESLLSEYNDERIQYIYGDNLGYKKSFLQTLKLVGKADYYAFADQDDVWLPQKLKQGIKCIENQLKNKREAYLYASSLTRVDKNLNFLLKQKFDNLVLTIGAEFTRHRLAGCTFIFNDELRQLVDKVEYNDFIKYSHDHFITIISMLNKTNIFVDTNSYILFRRHGDNASVDGDSKISKIKKDIKYYFGGQSRYIELSRLLLENYGYYMNSDNKKFLLSIKDYKKNIFNTIRLATNKRLDCGYWYFNLFIRLMIMFRLY